MGGQSSSDQQQSQQATPYGPAQGQLNNLLAKTGSISSDLTGNEQNAFTQLQSNANAGNPYSNQIGGVANSLLSGGPDRTGMVNDAYNSYRSNLADTAGGKYLDPNSNPFFSQLASGVGSEVQNRLSNLYAGSGRDPAGAGSYGGNLGRGIAEGLAPTFANQYNAERQNQLSAINSLYGAGGQTAGLLSGLDQAKFTNQQAGIGAADAANTAQNYGPMQTLQIEAAKRGIPLQTLASQMGLVLPAAQAFGTQTGTSKGTKEMSAAEEFGLWSKSLGGLFGGGGGKP